VNVGRVKKKLEISRTPRLLHLLQDVEREGQGFEARTSVSAPVVLKLTNDALFSFSDVIFKGFSQIRF
jgi:hypothetical protein